MKDVFELAIQELQDNLKLSHLSVSSVTMLYTMFSVMNDLIDTNPEAVKQTFEAILKKVNEPYYTTTLSIPIDRLNGSILN